MLELRNINIWLKNDGRQIVDNFSFSLGKGDKAVIIGEEGNGKSTLLKFIYDRRLISDYCDFEGDVITSGKIAFLPQMMEEHLYALRIADFIGSTEYYYHMDTLALLGLTPEFIFSDQPLGTLSGGEKVKAQLCKLLMEGPDILLLDEPTNDLDIPTLCWLERFMKETKLPILFISHDETLIENTANVILHMEQIVRKTKCRMTMTRTGYGEYLETRRRLFSHQGQIAQKQREEFAKKMEKWRQIYNRVDNEQEAITRQNPSGARLLKKKMHSVLSMKRRFEREQENFMDFPQEEEAIITKFSEDIYLASGKVVLDVTIDKLCIGERVLSENIRLFATGGQKIGIAGKNGVGKSTLLAAVWQELKDRKDIIAAYMPQNYAEVLDFQKTAVEYLAENYAKEDITKARTFMGSMRFTHEEMTGKIGSLSGGQKAKILFLEMVLKNANVLLLDEPTRNFSPLSAPVVRKALKEFGGTTISVSHDRKYLQEVCDVVYEMTENGLKQLNRIG
jgi:ATPase subunit of ABC transporter with duplicated ATPase domains